jgi:hypothetical protein
MWGPFYYYPFYYMAVLQTTPVTAGVYLLPAVLVLIPGSIITGRLVTRYNNYRIPVWFGWFCVTIFAILSVLWRFINVSTAVWVMTMMVFGIGQGAVLNAQQFATQAMCASGDEGHAAAMYLFLRQFGAAIGVGVGGATFQNVMALKLEWEGLPTDIASQAEFFVAELHTLPDDSDYKAKILDAYRYGFAGVFQVYLGVSAVAFILSLLFVKHYSLDKSLNTRHTLRESMTSKLLVGDSRWNTPTPTPWDTAADIDSYNPGAYNMNPNTNNTDPNSYHPDMYYHLDGSAYIPAAYQPEVNTHSYSNSYYEDPNVYAANAHQPELNVQDPNGYHTVLNTMPSAYHPEESGYDPYSYAQVGMSHQQR